jgi:hypothetical protein
MSPSGDKLPPTEWLFTRFTALSAWATSDLKTPSGGGEPRGCSSPVGVLKALLFLLMIVCFPLFLLPMMLSRFAHAGWSSLRYGATVDVASGEDARWRHGVVADAADVGQAGVVAEDIMLRDPGFRVSVLTRWAVAATALLRDSLVSGDATGTRAFMSNGLYQAHEALLDLRSRSNVSCAGSWQVTGALVIGVSRSPLTEQVRVRVECAGWREERHDPTRITLRGGPQADTWMEYLTFARSADAVTPPWGGLPAGRCPSCGAGLDLDPGGACRYCRGVVTAGRHDWVLVAWQRAPW